VDRWPDPTAQSPPGTFIDPSGIDVSADGTVAVVDRGNRRVQIFGPNGAFWSAFGREGTGPGELAAPRDIAVGDDRLFVTDPGTRSVIVLTRAGTEIGRITGLADPWGVAIGPGGRVFVTDRARHEIAVFDPAGTRLATYGRAGNRHGEFRRPQGIDVAADGTIYVADTGNNRVQILGSTGRAKEAFVPREVDRRLARSPQDVAADDRGNMFVASANGLAWFNLDLTRRVVLEFLIPMTGATAAAVEPSVGTYLLRNDGVRRQAEVRRYTYLARTNRHLARFGTHGGDFVRLKDVLRLALAPDGDLGVLTASAAVRYRPDGELVGLLPGAVPPGDLVFLPDGSVVVGNESAIRLFSPDGRAKWGWPSGPGTPGYPGLPGARGTFRWITALAYDSAAELLYVLDIGQGELVHLRLDGTLARSIHLNDDESFVVYRDMALSPEGDLVVVNQTTRQVEFRTPAWRLERVLVPRGVPARVATTPDHTFLLTRDGWVWRYSADLTLETVWNGVAGGHAVDVVATSDRIYTLDEVSNQVLAWRGDPAAQPDPPPTAPESVRCGIEVDKSASPRVLLLGETVDVTLTLDGGCPDIPPQADIILIIDRSGSMRSNNKLRAAQDAARVFLGAVDFRQSRVGLVSFNQTAQLNHALTSDVAALRTAIFRLTAEGGTNISLPVELAIAELSSPRRRQTALGVIVLLTDGNDNRGPVGPTVASLEAKLDGIRMFAIGLGADVNTVLLRRMASAPEDYYFAPGAGDLAGIYTDIARRLRAEVLLRTLIISDRFPDGFAYLGMESGPDPMVAGNQLTWTLSDIPFAGLALTYRLRPATPGNQATNIQADADYLDGLGHTGRATFPVPWVAVLQPVSPTPTPTPSPTLTPPPRWSEIYLPLTANRLCRPTVRHADVVLVLDTSTSMLWLTRGGRTKLDAARQAAGIFADLLALERDQAGIATFNRRAAVAAPLGSTSTAIHAALSGLTVAEGTRIDLGLQLGADELLSPRHRAVNRPVLILLTDGLPNGTTAEAVVARADAARSRGVEIYAIGLGPNVDPELLARVADEAEHLHFAPDGEDLERIYRAIAAVIPCR